MSDNRDDRINANTIAAATLMAASPQFQALNLGTSDEDRQRYSDMLSFFREVVSKSSIGLKKTETRMHVL